MNDNILPPGAGASRARGPYRRTEVGLIRKLFMISAFLLVALFAMLGTMHYVLTAELREPLEKLAPASSPAETALRQSSVSQLVLGGGFLTLLCLALLAYYARNANQNLQHLVAKVRGAAEHEGPHPQQVLVASHDELGELTYHINVLLERDRERAIASRELAERAISAGAGYFSGQENLLDLGRRQLEEVAQLSAAIEELARSARRATSDLEDATRGAESIVEKAEEGSKHAHACLANVQRLAESATQFNQGIEQLSQRTFEIDQATQLLRGLTAQTQLISLNAAVEATRLGKGNSGFSVVAGEIGRLSENATLACKQMFELLQTIHQEIRDVHERFAGVCRTAQAQEAQFSGMHEELQRVVADSQEARAALAGIGATLDEHAHTAEGVAQSLEGLVDGWEKCVSSSGECGRNQEELRDRIDQLGRLVRSTG